MSGHFHMLTASLAVLFSLALAASTVSPSASIPISGSSANTTSATGPAMITMPIYMGNYVEYDVVLSDQDGTPVTVSLDYLQPDLWLIDANALLPCSVALSINSANSGTYLPSSVTYSGQTYGVSQCYVDGGYAPKTTSTEVSGNITVTTTIAASAATASPYAFTYPYNFTASGFFTTADLKISKLAYESPKGSTSEGNSTSGSNTDVSLKGVQYLLVDSTNAQDGSFGLSGPSRSGGVLDTLKSQGLTYGNGFSAYYSSNTTDEGLGGFLLLGSVDKNLYSGDMYVFPQIPHVGWSQGSQILPILQLDTVTLRNLNTAQSVSVYSAGSVPVVVDPTLLFSYLPRALLINLALQVNGYYTPTYNTWILNCTAVNNINASVAFQFGPLAVNMPLTSLIETAEWFNLTFSDGSPACVFNVYPSDALGYASFGSSFLSSIYMAMDNEGGAIALANANTNLNVASQASSQTTMTQDPKTVGYIRSNYIPFATNATVSPSMTLTFGTPNASAQFGDPGLVTNVVISSGQVFVSQRRTSTTSRSSASASAASANSTTAGAVALRLGARSNGGFVLYMVLLVGGMMGLVCM